MALLQLRHRVHPILGSQHMHAVTLPIIAPAVISGWLLAFTLSLDDLVIASFVSGPGSSTLPMVIFSKVRLGVSPEINALGAVMIVLTIATPLLAGYLSRKFSKFKP